MNSGDLSFVQREAARAELSENPTAETLWACLVAYEGEVFYTMSGLPFSYRIRIGRDGKQTRELLIDRCTQSKSLVFSSIERAFREAVVRELVERPKALGDLRGVSYSYAILWKFGLFRAPVEAEDAMRGSRHRVNKF